MSSSTDWDIFRTKYATITELHNDDAKKQRDELFAQFDPNNNGYLSLAELEKGCRDILQICTVFEDAKPVIRKAYIQAKSIANIKQPNRTSSCGPDFVERSEFRYFLVYLICYYDIWHGVYAKMAGVDDGKYNDHRISQHEFMTSFATLQEWDQKQSIPILENESVYDPEALFQQIDINHGGYILFDELADYIISKQLHKEEE